MEYVYALWHMREDEDGFDHELMLGIFSTEEKAESAVESLKDKPGFKDYPHGFEIHEYMIDGRVQMDEGFVTVRPGEG